MTTFEFHRYRFRFLTADPVHFPQGKSANVLRGAFGMLLKQMAPPEVYGRLFEPGNGLGEGPSGLRDWPRPFAFRAAHLDGLTIPAGGAFHFDVHDFDLRRPALEHFQAVFTAMAARGIGPGRGKARLEAVERLDLAGEPTDGPCVLRFDRMSGVHRVRVDFLTPTELKAGGDVTDVPEFAVLLARLRDRIGTLSTFYGGGPMELDFQGMGERASAVRNAGQKLVRERVNRKSGRTGQVHSLGGFTGSVEYEGDLAEFVSWLEAGRWTGVGRQTVWGKGEIHTTVIGQG